MNPGVPVGNEWIKINSLKLQVNTYNAHVHANSNIHQ